jgi:hypothetical protein
MHPFYGSSVIFLVPAKLSSEERKGVIEETI